MPKVTIAIPTYNRKEYLEECLISILNQTFQDFEIIIFDNHSDYDIRQFISHFNDKRIKIIVNEKNLGNLENLKKIFNYQFGSKYVIVFHDDDTMHPLLLEKEVRVLEANQNMVFVASDLNYIKEPKKMRKFVELNKIDNLYILNNVSSFLELIFRGFDLCFDSAMYRTNILEDFSPCGHRFFKWGDRPYLINLAKKGSVGILKEKLVNYRIHLGQDSQANAIGKENSIFNLFLFYKESLRQPLSRKDKRLFYLCATNNLILWVFPFSQNWKEYKNFLKIARDKGIFKLWYLSHRGVYYFLKGANRKYVKALLVQVKMRLKRYKIFNRI